jgi:hypothetical protein
MPPIGPPIRVRSVSCGCSESPSEWSCVCRVRQEFERFRNGTAQCHDRRRRLCGRCAVVLGGPQGRKLTNIIPTGAKTRQARTQSLHPRSQRARSPPRRSRASPPNRQTCASAIDSKAH